VKLSNPSALLSAIPHGSARYREVFGTFLSRTDEKRVTHAYLDAFLAGFSREETLIDAGAGVGALLTERMRRFARVLAVEPNPAMAEALERSCPWAEIYRTTILEAPIAAVAKCVVCSHVLYYIPKSQWQATILRCLSWLVPGGKALFLLQSGRCDFQRLIAHFFGEQWAFDLARDARALARDAGLRVHVDRVPATVRTADLDEAVDITEFMFSVVPLSEVAADRALPTRQDLADYLVARHREGEHFVLSSDQDCVAFQPGLASGAER